MFEFKQQLPLKIVPKEILIFFKPVGLMLVIPEKLLEKNLAALMVCQFPKLILASILSTRIVTGPV
jgi:hypothetical protein